MRFFVGFSAVLVGLLAALAVWRGGDRPTERETVAAPVVTAPKKGLVVAPAPIERAPSNAVSEPIARETEPREGVERRAAEEKQLDRLRAEAARAIHSEEL